MNFKGRTSYRKFSDVILECLTSINPDDLLPFWELQEGTRKVKSTGENRQSNFMIEIEPFGNYIGYPSFGNIIGIYNNYTDASVFRQSIPFFGEPTNYSVGIYNENTDIIDYSISVNKDRIIIAYKVNTLHSSNSYNLKNVVYIGYPNHVYDNDYKNKILVSLTHASNYNDYGIQTNATAQGKGRFNMPFRKDVNPTILSTPYASGVFNFPNQVDAFLDNQYASPSEWFNFNYPSNKLCRVDEILMTTNYRIYSDWDNIIIDNKKYSCLNVNKKLKSQVLSSFTPIVSDSQINEMATIIFPEY